MFFFDDVLERWHILDCHRVGEVVDSVDREEAVVLMRTFSVVVKLLKGCKNRVSKTPIVSVLDIDDSVFVLQKHGQLSMLPSCEGVEVGDLETESKNVVHSQPRALPDVVSIVLEDELRHALNLQPQIADVREDELGRVQMLWFNIHNLLCWVGIGQLHRDPEGEAMELEQDGCQALAYHLLYRHN